MNLCMAVLQAAALDTAAGSLGPVPPLLVSGPELSRNPGRLHSNNSTGTDSSQSSPSGSTRLENMQAVPLNHRGCVSTFSPWA